MPRWSADQVLSLAPDASAQRAARALAAAPEQGKREELEERYLQLEGQLLQCRRI